MQSIILVSPPDTINEAGRFGLTIAYMAYRVGENGRLYRAKDMPEVSVGLMYLDCAVPPSAGLLGDILRECDTRKYSGLALDLPPENSVCYAELAAACARHGLTVWAPPCLFHSGCIVPVSTDIASGSLSARLSAAIAEYGPDRTAMLIQYQRTDYRIPAGSDGRELTEGELSNMLSRSRSFFSEDLCCNYFTYRTGNEAHAVLFDSANSIRRKLELGTKLGIKTAFLYYPHVKTILSSVI